MKFHLESPYQPAGDQPEAIRQLSEALRSGIPDVTLLGVTGSGKTFTMAGVIQELQRPALILSHNKTLAAQLYGEFKSFFPENAVEYFVSYYDYYQPEAYLPTTDTYIEKDLSINEQIDKLRLSAASALMSGRRDVIVVSSVSCLYGIGNPEDFHAQSILLRKGEHRSLSRLLYHLVDANYSRTEVDFKRGTFRVRGDTVDIFLGGSDEAVRVEFFGDEVDALSIIDPLTGKLNPNAKTYKWGDDWLKEPFSNGLRQEYTANVSAGNDITKVYASLGYLGDKGYVKNSDFKRYNGKIKLDQMIGQYIKVGGSVAYTRTESDAQRNEGTNRYGNLFYFAQGLAQRMASSGGAKAPSLVQAPGAIVVIENPQRGRAHAFPDGKVQQAAAVPAVLAFRQHIKVLDQRARNRYDARGPFV